MSSLAVRHREPELMDDPGLDRVLHQQALRGLRRVNRISRTVPTLWKPIRELAQQTPGGPLRVLDIACGGGDTTIALAQRARRSQLPIEVCGCDISQTAVDCATATAMASSIDVRFFRTDVIADPLPDDFDIMCTSLFLHHLDDDDLVSFLASIQQAARRMILMTDLVRSRLGYVLAWCGVRLLTRSRICHVDGPLSVRAAFTPCEMLQLSEKAGLRNVTLDCHWPQRYLLAWRRS